MRTGSPAVGRLAQTAVVKIESVDVDVRPGGHKMQKPQDCSSGLAPLARRLGGDMSVNNSSRAAKSSPFMKNLVAVGGVELLVSPFPNLEN